MSVSVVNKLTFIAGYELPFVEEIEVKVTVRLGIEPPMGRGRGWEHEEIYIVISDSYCLRCPGQSPLDETTGLSTLNLSYI
jgi:hypothetical protein